MMGGHHAISGTAAYLALTSGAVIAGTPIAAQVLGPQPLGHLLAGTVVATGAALLPDIDHPSGTIARSAGPASRAVSSVIGGAAGHRGATHTLLGALAFTGIAAVIAAADVRVRLPVIGETQILAVLLVTAMVVFAVRAMKIVRGMAPAWIAGLATAVVVLLWAPDTSIWLPLAVGIGVIAHIAGDALTTAGVPAPTWPYMPKPGIATPLWHKNGFVALPILGDTGSGREWLLAVVLTGYVLVAGVSAMLGS